ncbi:hypothetical protein ACLOJK_028074 [Asimina triloba]
MNPSISLITGRITTDDGAWGVVVTLAGSWSHNEAMTMDRQDRLINGRRLLIGGSTTMVVDFGEDGLFGSVVYGAPELVLNFVLHHAVVDGVFCLKELGVNVRGLLNFKVRNELGGESRHRFEVVAEEIAQQTNSMGNWSYSAHHFFISSMEMW